MKYDSTYFNKERYYDPTAGAALLSIIRGEKRQRYAAVPTKKSDDNVAIFADKFCAHYKETHPPRANGKPLRYTNPSVIKKQIKLYEFCMEHCEKDWFTIEAAVERFDLGSPRKVEQCFSGRGNIGKLIRCWNDFKSTGTFNWNQRRQT